MKTISQAGALACCLALAAFSQARPQPKQIDIGAAEAPLSDSERTSLDQAVRKHDFAAEKAVVDRALTEHPKSPELLVMEGRLAYLEKHPKESADAFLLADALKPLTETDRMTLALALSFSERLPEARAQFQTLIKGAPANAEYVFLLARADTNNGRLEDAAAEYSKAIGIDPTMVRAYEGLGRMQEALNKPEEAKKTYEAGVARNRANKVHWDWSPLDLAILLLKSDDLDTADKLLREALLYNPRNGWAHYHMGQVFQKKGNEAEAMTEYKEAVIDEPGIRQAWLALGRQFTRQGNQAEADKALAMFKRLEAENNARLGRKN